MKPSTLLRIASVLGVLYVIGHSMGAPWTPTTGAPEKAVVEAMKAVHFDVMGAQRSYWDFYFGFGIQVSVYLLALALALWQTASLARAEGGGAGRMRPMMLILLAGYAGIGVVTAMYFFIIPVVMSAAICVCIGLAWVMAGRGVVKS